jgi:hypothetical protein
MNQILTEGAEDVERPQGHDTVYLSPGPQVYSKNPGEFK